MDKLKPPRLGGVTSMGKVPKKLQGVNLTTPGSPFSYHEFDQGDVLSGLRVGANFAGIFGQRIPKAERLNPALNTRFQDETGRDATLLKKNFNARPFRAQLRALRNNTNSASALRSNEGQAYLNQATANAAYDTGIDNANAQIMNQNITRAKTMNMMAADRNADRINMAESAYIADKATQAADRNAMIADGTQAIATTAGDMYREALLPAMFPAMAHEGNNPFKKMRLRKPVKAGR
jgi:hypothetical protein